MKKIFLISLGGILLFSCSKIKKESSGIIKTEEKSIAQFSSIESLDNIDVFYTQDSISSLKIEAGEHLIDYIKTDIVNGKLIIYEAENDILNTKRIRVYVSSDSINSLILEGSGNVDCENIDVTNLNVKLSGSGNINVNASLENYNLIINGSGDINTTGTTLNQNIEIKGSGDVNNRYLLSNNGIVNVVGSGDVTVQTMLSLNGSISGSGNIYYYGNPSTINSSITGSGELINKN